MVVGIDRHTYGQRIHSGKVYILGELLRDRVPVADDPVRNLLGGREDGEAWTKSLRSSMACTGS